MRRFSISVMLIFLFTAVAFSQKNWPRSREATLLESTSPSEVMIRSTGIGIDPKHRRPKAKILDASANRDARKTAVWFVLFGGTDPLLQTEEEKKDFARLGPEFFKDKNIKRFISWEADYYDQRIKIDGVKKLKITKTFKINKGLLEEELARRNIIQKPAELFGEIGLPSIMVIPEAQGDTAPLTLLKTDADIKKGAEVIESYLTAKRFEVIVPEQQQMMQELISTQYALAGAEEDYSYLLALSVGSDIYITYNVTIETRRIGSSTVRKGIVACRAYETTTARLLGTETGYSQERPAPNAVVIEEAMHDAADKVLSRILGYWKRDIQQGTQYKIILSINTDFDSNDAEKIIFKMADILKSVVTEMRENVVSDYTYDVLVWVLPDQISSTMELYRKIKLSYDGPGDVKRISISRKLLMLDVNQE